MGKHLVYRPSLLSMPFSAKMINKIMIMIIIIIQLKPTYAYLRSLSTLVAILILRYIVVQLSSQDHNI